MISEKKKEFEHSFIDKTINYFCFSEDLKTEKEYEGRRKKGEERRRKSKKKEEKRRKKNKGRKKK